MLNYGQLNKGRAAERFLSTRVGQLAAPKEIETCDCGTSRLLYDTALYVCVRDVNPKQVKSLRRIKKGKIMKTKKLVALLMAVMLIVGIFAIPVSANADALKCKYCSSINFIQEPGCYSYLSQVNSCSYLNYIHNHYVDRYYITYTCSNGHTWEELVRVSTRCPYQ